MKDVQAVWLNVTAALLAGGPSRSWVVIFIPLTLPLFLHSLIFQEYLMF